MFEVVGWKMLLQHPGIGNKSVELSKELCNIRSKESSSLRYGTRLFRDMAAPADDRRDEAASARSDLRL